MRKKIVFVSSGKEHRSDSSLETKRKHGTGGKVLEMRTLEVLKGGIELNLQT